MRRFYDGTDFSGDGWMGLVDQTDTVLNGYNFYDWALGRLIFLGLFSAKGGRGGYWKLFGRFMSFEGMTAGG